MRDASDERVLQHMREGTVTDVVHQDGSLHSLCLAIKNEEALLLEREDGLTHQVEGPQRVLETGVTSSRIDHRSQSQLVDAVEPLHQRMLHDVVEQSAGYFDKPEHRVVDNLCIVHVSLFDLDGSQALGLLF